MYTFLLSALFSRESKRKWVEYEPKALKREAFIPSNELTTKDAELFNLEIRMGLEFSGGVTEVQTHGHIYVHRHRHVRTHIRKHLHSYTYTHTDTYTGTYKYTHVNRHKYAQHTETLLNTF